jgi:TolB-like protein/Tfp pilus assembly protein PilF
MEADEASTLAALRSHRGELLEPIIAEHNGRIVKFMGDGLLAEFFSAVQAVKCAVDIQQKVGKRSANLPEGKQIVYRIGINIGDIIVEDQDIYGDGVNIASRLEGLAAPGGICIAASVSDQLTGKTDIVFERAGEQILKNISKPVEVWRWVSDVVAPTRPNFPLPGKPSLAVMPFVNMSGDPDQEFFADGMTEDIITTLSRYRWFFVIDRNSSFTYKGHAIDAKKISRELGVRYVVEGSVRKSDKRVRVTTQLIDAATAHHLWAERYDRDIKDIFALQDEITETVVGAVEPELGAVERERARRKPPGSLDAWDSYQRGLWHFYGDRTRDGLTEAKRLFQCACDLDPTFSAAYADLAWVHTVDVTLGLTDDTGKSLDAASQAAERAVALDIRDAGARFARGRVHILRHAFEKAIVEMEAALDINPSFARGHYGLGMALLYGGQPQESIPKFEAAIRLNPRAPDLWTYYQMIASAYFNLGNYEQASVWAEKSVQQPNAPFMPFVHASAALGQLGRKAEAHAMLAEVYKRKPDFNADAIKETVGLYGTHSGAEKIIEGLREAGLEC